MLNWQGLCAERMARTLASKPVRLVTRRWLATLPKREKLLTKLRPRGDRLRPRASKLKPWEMI